MSKQTSLWECFSVRALQFSSKHTFKWSERIQTLLTTVSYFQNIHSLPHWHISLQIPIIKTCNEHWRYPIHEPQIYCCVISMQSSTNLFGTFPIIYRQTQFLHPHTHSHQHTTPLSSTQWRTHLFSRSCQIPLLPTSTDNSLLFPEYTLPSPLAYQPLDSDNQNLQWENEDIQLFHETQIYCCVINFNVIK